MVQPDGDQCQLQGLDMLCPKSEKKIIFTLTLAIMTNKHTDIKIIFVLADKLGPKFKGTGSPDGLSYGLLEEIGLFKWITSGDTLKIY